jgi:hypothetical protein
MGAGKCVPEEQGEMSMNELRQPAEIFAVAQDGNDS